MLLKTLLIKQAKINIGDVTHITVNDDIQFSVIIPPTNKNSHVYQIQGIGKNFEILEIRDADNERSLPYDYIDKTFASNYHFKDGFVFHILADIDFHVNNVDEFCCTDNTYKLHLPQASIASLKPRECFKKSITFNNFPNITLSCYIKKVDNEIVEVHVVNPKRVGINGSVSDFRTQFYATEDINVNFVFDPHTSKRKESENEDTQK
uniref:Galectin n=1 Tax=Panagrolaimus sp. ES5 TaxID=591445 RepID=A0AC34FLN6_9BILA